MSASRHAQAPRRRWWRWALGLVLLMTLVFVLGPRNPFGPDAPAARPAPPAALAELDDWLVRSEAGFADIRPGLAKRITWHGGQRLRQPWAVVYVHGFSASLQETAPLARRVAEGLGANLFETRLAGHGRSAAAMAEPTPQDWLADMQEALALGRLLGERVLVLSVSTGGTLSAWQALRPEGQKGLAYAMVSPNFGPKNPLADVVNWPWGRPLSLLIEGQNRGWPPRSEAEAVAWTTRYPTSAVFPMMALVKQVRESDLSRMTAPVLVLYSPRDETVNATQTEAAFARMGSRLKTLQAITDSDAVGQHVLAGDIRAPRSTEPMARRIIDWTRSHPADAF